jgi:flagellum-specific peptidoglycan hydrolase FlgJ
MPDIKIPVSAQLNAADIDKQLDDLTARINRAGQAIAAANRMQFNPISKSTAADLDKITKNFEALKRGAPSLAQKINSSGQGGKSFLDVDWGMVIGNSLTRELQRMGAFSKVVGFTGASFAQPASQSTAAPYPTQSSAPSHNNGEQASRGGSGGRGGGGYRPASPGASWGGFGRNVLGAGLRGTGSAGAAADGALTAGSGAMSAGLGAALGVGIGSMIASAVGSAVGAIAGKIGDAQNENVAADTLKRTLGDTNVSFEALKEGLRAASGAIGTTYNETERLGMSFAKLGNVTERQYGELSQEVANAGGFGRSFGLDPSQSVQFFGQMRGVGVTRDVQDSQRLGLVIGEAIVKSGAFAKADEVLQAIGGFATQQTRLGLVAANTTGYASALAGLIGSGIPGLDVNGAAGILGRANAAIQSGGAAGDAGQNFLYSALGTRLHLDPIQTRILQEGGAFGTGEGTFGKGSLFAQWAKQNGVTVPSIAAGSTQSNLSLIMSKLRDMYGTSPERAELRVDAESRLLHLSNSQAMGLDLIYGHGGPANADSMLKRLQRLNIPIDSVNASGISRLAQIDSSVSLTEQQKDAQTRAAAAQAQEPTKGSEVRDSVVGLQNTLQGFADKAVPALTASRDALLLLAGKSAGGVMTPAQLHDAVLAGQRTTLTDRASARIGAAQKAVDALQPNGYYAPSTDQMKALYAAQANLDSETKAANAERDSGLAQISAGDLNISPKLAARAGDAAVQAALADQSKYGVPAAVTLAQYGLESGYGTSGIAKAANNPFGIHAVGNEPFIMGTDVDPKTGKRVPTKFRKFDSIQQSFDEHAKLLATNPAYAEARKHEDDPMAFAAALTNHYATDPQYGTKVQAIMRDGMYSATLPGNAQSATQTQTQKHEFSGIFYLNTPNGAPAAAPVTVSKTVGPPQPAGTY